MKKILIPIFVLSLVIPFITFASRCEQIGSTTFCDDGSRYEQIGNTIFGNDGSRYEQMGNTIFGNDGSRYEQMGNTTFVNDGSRYEQIGNNIFGNDGSRYEQIGNINFGSGGTNSCPTNSSYDYLSSKCKCKTGYIVSGSKCIYDYSYTTPVNNPTEPVYETCQDTYGINSYSSSSGKCGCITGYEWATDKKSCIKSIPITTNNIVASSAPTCTISFIPDVVEVGQPVTFTFSTKGNIEGFSGKGTGDIELKPFKNYDVFLSSIKTGGYSNKIKTSIIGLATEKGTVSGPGGSSSCAGSYTVIPKTTETIKEAKKDVIIVPTIEQKNESEVIKTTPEPTKKLKWYQKILNWFK